MKETKCFCLCEADCIHKKGIFKIEIVSFEGGKKHTNVRKFDRCNNTSKKCNCVYRRKWKGVGQ